MARDWPEGSSGLNWPWSLDCLWCWWWRPDARLESVAALVKRFPRPSSPASTLPGSCSRRPTERQSALAQAKPGGHRPSAVGGAAPATPSLNLPHGNLGFAPAHEARRRESSLEALGPIWLSATSILGRLLPLLERRPPRPAGHSRMIRWCLKAGQPAASCRGQSSRPTQGQPGCAWRSQRCAFHFRYPEASELLAGLGLALLAWQPLADEPCQPAARA